MSQQKEYKFHVIELMDPSHIDPEKYVCVPNSWITLPETSDGPALVKFPVEKLSETKKRVEKEEILENWSVFLANIKYSTNSYKDAKNYVKILNKIFDQEQSSMKIDEDVPSTSDKKVLVRTTSTPSSDAEPMELDLIKAGGRIGRKKSQVGATDSPPKARRYLTRQSLRISSSSNNTVSLPDQTPKKNLPTTSHCAVKSDKTNNQENEQLTKNTSELMSKWHFITALRSVFGDNFTETLEQLHSKYEHNQLMLEKMQFALKENCKIIKRFIDLTNEAKNALSISDLDSAVKDIENSMTEVNINENNSNKATGLKVQNDTRIQEEKKHNSGDTEAKNNNPLNKIRGQSRKFTLPPEYDPEDSRWTLKHREMKSGLVELLPYSRVYIDAIKLSNCKITSKDSKALARSLLLEIFSENALSICSLTGKKPNAFDLDGTSVRPGLDEHARTVLLNYVKKHAAEQNWVEVDSQLISNTIRNKMQAIRGKHQDIVEK